jgi:hypothetical protein
MTTLRSSLKCDGDGKISELVPGYAGGSILLNY